MNGKFLVITRPAACLCAAVLGLAAPASAQRDVQTGGSRVRLQADSSVTLFPREAGPGRAGSITWTCSGRAGGLTSEVDLGTPGAAGQTQPMIWRLDEHPEDTTHLEGRDGATGWSVREADAALFTLGAKGAVRLMIRVPGHASAGHAAEYRYDLAGARSALDRLPCAANTVLVRRLADGMANRPARAERTGPPGDGTYELSALEELPRPTNMTAFHRAMMSGYPPALRDAGVTGTVNLRFRVLENGRVDPESMEVTYSSNEQFDEPSLRAARVLRFNPAKIGGRPVPVWIEMPFRWAPPERG